MSHQALNRSEAAAFVSRRCRRPVGASVLRYWERIGLLRRQTPGNRVPASYTVADLVRAETVVRLRESGASLQRVRKAVRTMTRHVPEIVDHAGDWRLAVTGRGDVVRLESTETVLELTRQPGQLSILPASEMVREARAELERKIGAA